MITDISTDESGQEVDEFEFILKIFFVNVNVINIQTALIGKLYKLWHIIPSSFLVLQM